MSKNDLRYISDNMVARESALQMLILEAVGFGYELVRLACPRNPTERNPTERNPTERNTETQRHRVFYSLRSHQSLCLCVSVFHFVSARPLVACRSAQRDACQSKKARSYFLIITKLNNFQSTQRPPGRGCPQRDCRWPDSSCRY